MVVLISIQCFVHGIVANGLILTNFFNNQKREKWHFDTFTLLNFVLISQLIFIINSLRGYVLVIKKCHIDSKNIKYVIQDILKTL